MAPKPMHGLPLAPLWYTVTERAKATLTNHMAIPSHATYSPLCYKALPISPVEQQTLSRCASQTPARLMRPFVVIPTHHTYVCVNNTRGTIATLRTILQKRTTLKLPSPIYPLRQHSSSHASEFDHMGPPAHASQKWYPTMKHPPAEPSNFDQSLPSVSAMLLHKCHTTRGDDCKCMRWSHQPPFLEANLHPDSPFKNSPIPQRTAAEL